MRGERPALVRLEQLYSFPWPEMRAVLARYEGLEELVWAQEEPRNMGAWTYVEPKLREVAPPGSAVTYVGRPERASPAEGYPAAHAAEQGRIIERLGGEGPRRAGAAAHDRRGGTSQGLNVQEGGSPAVLFHLLRRRFTLFARIGRSDACRASSLSGSERCSP